MRPPAIQAERSWSPPTAPCCRCFNEAACNTGGTPVGRLHRGAAGSRFNEAACNTGGTRNEDWPASGAWGASMRPPAIQAERAHDRREPVDSRHASMRPPAIQAERPTFRRRRGPGTRSFNEAACNTGGTRSAGAGSASCAAGFNEAACNTGGTRAGRRASGRPSPCFNEAACNTGGTHDAERDGDAVGVVLQ